MGVEIFHQLFFSPEGVVSRSAALEFLGRRVGMAFLEKKVFLVGAKSQVHMSQEAKQTDLMRSSEENPHSMSSLTVLGRRW